MSELAPWALFVAAWTLFGVLIGLALGRWLGECSRCRDRADRQLARDAARREAIR